LGIIIVAVAVADAALVLRVAFAIVLVGRDSLPWLKRAIMRFVRAISGPAGCARLAYELLGGTAIAGDLRMANY
jgi:hypothetical protein